MKAPSKFIFEFERSFLPPITLGPEGLALLVIDMQYYQASPDHGYSLAVEQLHPGLMKYFNDRNEHEVVPAIARLIAGCRERGVAIIYFCTGSSYRDLRDIPPRYRELIRTIERSSGVDDIHWAGNPAYAIREELKPEPQDTVIHKTTWGAFNSSELEETLRSRQIDTLILTGVSTNCCVETTARDAADRGFSVVVVEECTADLDEAAHYAALRALSWSFARILWTVNDVLEAIDRRKTI